jgi:hypothetical protein
MCQALFAQNVMDEKETRDGACVGKIEKSTDGRQRITQMWPALIGCLKNGGFIDADDIKKNWGIGYRNDILLVGGVRIADYESDFLSLRIENRKSSPSQGQVWARYQFGVGASESARSELNISMKNYIGSLTFANVEKDLKEMGFEEAPVRVRPEMIIFSKNYGLTKVTAYIVSPVETVPEVISLRLDGFK